MRGLGDQVPFNLSCHLSLVDGVSGAESVDIILRTEDFGARIEVEKDGGNQYKANDRSKIMQFSFYYPSVFFSSSAK